MILNGKYLCGRYQNYFRDDVYDIKGAERVMVKGVIFDVDGVLLNSMPVWENLGELYLQKFGIQAEKDLSEILYEMSLKEAAEYLISHYGLKQTVEEVTKGIVKEVEQFYVEKVPLKEGVREYLKELKERKIPMVIATSGDRKNAEAALKRLKAFFLNFEGTFYGFRDRKWKESAGSVFRSGTSTGYRSGADLGL